MDVKYLSTFISEIMDGIDFSSGKIQVAVVTYTSTAVTLFNLNMYNSSDELRQSIEAMPSTSSYSRSLNVGLEHARDNIFTSANGDRADAWKSIYSLEQDRLIRTPLEEIYGHLAMLISLLLVLVSTFHTKCA